MNGRGKDGFRAEHESFGFRSGTYTNQRGDRYTFTSRIVAGIKSGLGRFVTTELEPEEAGRLAWSLLAMIAEQHPHAAVCRHERMEGMRGHKRCAVCGAPEGSHPVGPPRLKKLNTHALCSSHCDMGRHRQCSGKADHAGHPCACICHRPAAPVAHEPESRDEYESSQSIRRARAATRSLGPDSGLRWFKPVLQDTYPRVGARLLDDGTVYLGCPQGHEGARWQVYVYDANSAEVTRSLSVHATGKRSAVQAIRRDAKQKIKTLKGATDGRK